MKLMGRERSSKALRGLAVRLLRDRSGSTVIYVALVAPVLAGLAGLAIDVGVWYADSRRAQSAVDSAAVAGALEII